MADQLVQTPNIYALLIGIDYYQPNRLYKSLKGAVRDINLVADYLLKTLKIPSERIFKLTSQNPETAETVETKDPEPTYKNIVAKFQAITEIAQPGEQVYIHYSGHGGRAITIYPELKGADQPDEGIVPMDVGDEGGHYLRDVELATLLKRMTDKGLIVTVILDSCHSGGATRGDDVAIRGPGETDTAPRDKESLVAPREELVKNWQALTEGTAASSTMGRWLPQPRDYVLLAACRPSELAYEYAVSGKQRHGALTYWMIDTLTSSPSGLTYKTLHDRIGAKIQSKFPQQMPMLLGESDRFVFGVERGSLQYAVNVLEVIEEEVTEVDSESKKVPKQVRLDAGMANGLSPGARFAIYAFGTTDFTQKNKQLAIVEIAEVGASDAWADVVEVLRQEKIEQGSQAVMLSAPVELVRGVRLFKKEVGEKENELPQAIADKQDDALKAVEEALAGNGWLKLADAQQKEDYQVAVNRQGEYEICVGTPIENLTPALKIEDSEAPQKVVQRLVHLAKYQAIQELSNQFSDLTNQLEVELLTQPNWRPGMPKKPQPFADPTNLVVKSGEYTFLRIKNTSPQVLNVAVLNLQATWEVSRFQIRTPERIFYPLNPNEEIPVPLSFKLPDTERYKKARETLKVFASIRGNDFRWLELPSLDEEIAPKAGLSRADNPLGKLLAAVGADVDEPLLGTKAAVPIFDPSQEWTTKEVQITVTRAEPDVEGRGVERGVDNAAPSPSPVEIDINKSPSNPINQKREGSNYKDVAQLKEQLEQVYRIQEPPSPTTVINKDLVDCSVFSPPAVAYGDMFLVQVFVHLPEQAEIAKQHAELFDSDAKQLGVRSLGIPIERGTELTFHLSIPKLEVDDPIQQLVWNGKADSVQFGVTVPPDLIQNTVVGTVTVSQNSIPIGHLKFKLSITPSGSCTSKESKPVGEAAHFYKKAFVSYSSKDRKEVLKRVQGLTVTGIEVFQDVLNLEPGDRWEKELYRHIDECDLFLLFWSTAAKESKWVLKEALYALERQGKDGLHPP